MRRVSLLSLCFASLAVACGPAEVVRASTGAEAAAADPAGAPTERRADRSERSPVPEATYAIQAYQRATDRSLPMAGAIVRVRAPFAIAKEIAADLRDLRQLNPYIEKSVVVAKEGATTDVYLRVPTVTDESIWAIVRFTPAPSKDAFVLRGAMVRGNLDDLRVVVRVAPAGPDESVGSLEVLADPAMPVPRSWVIRDTRAGVELMLERFRARAERAARVRRAAANGPPDGDCDYYGSEEPNGTLGRR